MKKALLLIPLLLVGCSQSAEEKWLGDMYQKCQAMGSRAHYNEDTKVFTCYRTPFARHPKEVFREVFTGEK